MPLRAWQAEAIEKYEAAAPTDFLVTATPGAGKTTFGLALALRLRAARVIERVIVVAPTDHLRTQWADAAVRLGLVLDPNLSNAVGPVRPDAHGYVTTYAQVAAKPLLHRRRTEAKKTLVILDEIHHAGDSLSWGDAVYEAFDPARRRLSLTGTPFRTNPNERIPFVTYRDAGLGEVISEADYTYGYREALADDVVRPVVFAAYAGTSRWMSSAGEVLAADLGEDSSRAVEDAAWRTALDPAGAWVAHVIAAIDDRVSHLRETGMPDAAGLILASDQDAARAYAAIVTKITREKPVVILSDDPKASKKIHQFEHGSQRLAVCVRMVSEGVDIPRAAVLGFLTSYRTPLFFAQAVGRVVRARSPRETATVFLPAVRPLLALAAALEEQRDHVVRIAGPEDDLDALVEVEERENEPGGHEFTPLEAEAAFAHVLHAGRAITAPVQPLDSEADDFLGLPGLLTPEQTAALLASRDVELRRRTSGLREEESTGAPSSWREVETLRKDINRLVAQVAARTGRQHAEVHVELRQAVPGPRTASASVEVLLARRDHLLSQTL
ncbi:DEAD/DEAH box helicase [Microlunatus ginsengisoli]|uniref:DEAD/DEAH box helicase n=1 Tax=Microlunatus ginsengisoli TaxID=363863 RepID=A0ABP6ZNP9_9ACTN